MSAQNGAGGLDALPLCDGGRCSALLAGVATVRDRAVQRNGELLAEVIRRVLADFDLDPTRDDVRTSVIRHIGILTGATANEPGS